GGGTEILRPLHLRGNRHAMRRERQHREEQALQRPAEIEASTGLFSAALTIEWRNGMPCDHQLLAQHLCDYIEDSLPAALHAACADAVAHCPQCREVYERALEFQRLSTLWEDCDVPPW